MTAITKRKLRLVTLAIAVAIMFAGCATDVIIFFPKASATKAADNVIDDIFGAPAIDPKPAPAPAPTPTALPTVEVLKK